MNRAAMTQQLIGALLVLVLALATMLVIARSITGPIRQMVSLVDDIADGEGDLTKRLETRSQDELGPWPAASTALSTSCRRCSATCRRPPARCIATPGTPTASPARPTATCSITRRRWSRC